MSLAIPAVFMDDLLTTNDSEQSLSLKINSIERTKRSKVRLINDRIQSNSLILSM